MLGTSEAFPGAPAQKNEGAELPQHPEIDSSRQTIEDKEGHTATVDFLYVAHAPEYAKEIAEHLKDADVVAMEVVTDSPTFRSLFEFSMNMETGAAKFDELPPEQFPDYLEFFLSTFGNEGHFVNSVVKHLRETKKRIVFVDVSGETKIDEDGRLEPPAKVLNLLGSLSSEKYLNSPEENIRASEIVATAVAQESKDREKLVAEQVKSLIQEEKIKRGSRPLRVAVIQGAMHTATAHSLSKEVPANISFVPRFRFNSSQGFQMLVFNHFEELMRRKRFMPEKPIPRELAEKALLSQYVTDIFPRVQLPLPKEGVDAALNVTEITHLNRLIVDDFSDNERQQLLHDIQQAQERAVLEVAPFVDILTQLMSLSMNFPQKQLEKERRNFMSMKLRKEVGQYLNGIIRRRIGPPPQSIAEYKNLLANLDRRRKERGKLARAA